MSKVIEFKRPAAQTAGFERFLKGHVDREPPPALSDIAREDLFIAIFRGAPEWGEGLREGDVLWCQRADSAREGQFVLVADGDDLAFRHFKRDAGDTLVAVMVYVERDFRGDRPHPHKDEKGGAAS